MDEEQEPGQSLNEEDDQPDDTQFDEHHEHHDQHEQHDLNEQNEQIEQEVQNVQAEPQEQAEQDLIIRSGETLADFSQTWKPTSSLPVGFTGVCDGCKKRSLRKLVETYDDSRGLLCSHCRGVSSDLPQATTISSEAVVTTQDRAKTYPRMSYFSPATISAEQTTPRTNELSITFPHELVTRLDRVSYLSSSTTSATIAGMHDDEVQVQGKIVTIDDTNWFSFCRFYDFDPQAVHPQSAITIDGWKSDVPLKAYQFYVAAWAVRHVFRGNDACILNIPVGTGKTAMMLAIAVTLSQVQSNPRFKDLGRNSRPVDQALYKSAESELFRSKLLSEVQSDRQHFLGNPKLLARHSSKVYVPRGVTIFLVPNHLVDNWAQSIRKFIVTKPYLLIRATVKEQFKGIEKQGTWKGWHHMKDDIVPYELLPRVKDLHEHFKGTNIKRGLSLTKLLAPSSDDRALPHHSHIIIITTTDGISKWFFTKTELEQHALHTYDRKEKQARFEAKEAYAKLDQPQMSQQDFEDEKLGSLEMMSMAQAAHELRAVSIGRKKPHELKRVTIASMVGIDEVHEASKDIKLSPWTHVGDFPGNPVLIAADATAYNKPLQIMPFIHAAHAHYIAPVKIKARTINAGSVFHNQQSCMKLMAWENIAVRDDDEGDWTDAEFERLQELMFVGHSKDFGVIDKYFSSDKDKKDAADENDFESSVEQPEDVKAASNRFGQLLSYFTLVFDNSLRWQPDPTQPAIDAIRMPHHNHYDVFPEMPAACEESLRPLWQTSSETAINETSRIKFFSFATKWRVYPTFPMLRSYMNEDEALAGELGDFDVKAVTKIWDALKRTDSTESSEQGDTARPVLLSYIKLLIETSPVIQVIIHAVRQWRLQKNVFGFPPKIVLAMHKPFNAMVVYLVFCYLVEQKDPLFTDISDIIFLRSWSKSKTELDDMMKRFKTSQNTMKGYKDKPFLCIAVMSQIRSGLDLPPAHKFVVGDCNWEWLFDLQGIGRIHRQSGVQKNPVTESIRIVTWAQWFRFGLWQARRHSTMSTLQTAMKDSSEKDPFADEPQA